MLLAYLLEEITYVDTVDVTESSSNAEVRGNGRKSLVDVVNVLGLSVEGVVVNILIVDTILLTTGNTDLHLEPEAERRHALEVLHAGSNVLLLRLLRKIEHVRGEERLPVTLEILLIGLQHAVEPREELLSAVIGVQDHGTEARRLGVRHGTTSVSTYTPYSLATVRTW